MEHPPKKRKLSGSAETCETDSESRSTDDQSSLQDDKATPVDNKVLVTWFSSVDKEMKKFGPGKVKMREVFAQKYFGVKIYVNSIVDMPSTIEYARQNTLGNDTIQTFTVPGYYEYCHEDLIPVKIQEKWSSEVPLDKRICLNYISACIFKSLARRMTYEKNAWIYDETVNLDYLVGSETEFRGAEGNEQNESTVAVSESGDGNKPENHQRQRENLVDESGDGKRTQNQQGEMTGLSEKSGDYAKMKKYESVLNSYNLLEAELLESLAGALVSNMRNSCGRDAISLLVRCVCRIAFGGSYERNRIFVYQVGTSNYPFEGFPISLKIPTNENGSDQSGVSTSCTLPASLQISGYVSPGSDSLLPAGSDSASVSDSSSKSFGKGYIYPDLIVACQSGCVSKFLLLVEVKSDRTLNVHDFAQLVRQAVGALLDQEQVYGLLISQAQAYLVKFYRHADSNSIRYTKNIYVLHMLHSLPAFRDSAWFELFTDLIKAVDSAKEDIKQ